MREIGLNILLLSISNVFMTFAWYAHLKNLSSKPWIIAVIVSWGIAFFEYIFQVPANRIGYGALSLGQLKILQEVITLSVFVPFAFFYMKSHSNLTIFGRAFAFLAPSTSFSVANGAVPNPKGGSPPGSGYASLTSTQAGVAWNFAKTNVP
jgi:uncharacterized protein (DUF486 family)